VYVREGVHDGSVLAAIALPLLEMRLDKEGGQTHLDSDVGAMLAHTLHNQSGYTLAGNGCANIGITIWLT
jgi:hypothetical protein